MSTGLTNQHPGPELLYMFLQRTFKIQTTRILNDICEADMKLMRILLPVTSWTHFVPSDAKRNMDLLAPFVWSSALNPSFTKATGAPNHVCLHNFDCCFWTSLSPGPGWWCWNFILWFWILCFKCKKPT